MVMQEGQQQALYGCSGGVRGWGGVAAFISAAAAGDAGEEVGENRPNRRPKQKKTPQRGLGVAQLEKIRLEEQQSGAVVVASSPSLPGPFSPAMPLPPLPLPSTPFSGASDLNPPATRPANIPIPSAPFCDLLVPAPPPAADAPVVAPPAGLAGHGFLPPLLWNPLEMSPQGAEASNKAFSFPFSLQEESSNTIWQPSGPFERQHQHWQQQSKHPLPNSSLNPSVSLPLSGVKLRNMEPPSNQSSNMSKPASPLWPGDENVVEMAGMKRPWPFHLDAMADYTNFPACKLPLPRLPFPRADEHSPMSGCNLLDFKPGSTSLRDGPPSSATFQADGRSLYGNPPEKRFKERSSAPVYGDFLTLGASLPPPALPAAPPKLKQCTSTLLPQYCQESSSSVPAPTQYHCLQGTTDDASLRYGGSSRSPEQLPFYSFLPMRSSNQETSLAETRHEDVGSIDLNLKL